MMGTSRETIQDWFERGVSEKKRYMVIMCDTFDYDDYPTYHDTIEEARAEKAKSGSNMTMYMESYDLSLPMKPQLTIHRSHAI